MPARRDALISGACLWYVAYRAKLMRRCTKSMGKFVCFQTKAAPTIEFEGASIQNMVYDGLHVGTLRGAKMATQITFTGTVAHNDDDEFPFVAVVIADGQVLARYPVRTSAAGRAKLDEAFAMLNAQAATQTDAARYEELSDIIAWLDAMPHTESAGVIAAQRERAVAEQMEIAKRRPQTCTPTRRH
jgi:hypothetical protein